MLISSEDDCLLFTELKDKTQTSQMKMNNSEKVKVGVISIVFSLDNNTRILFQLGI